ncbi:Rieske 2Fe-2S domain-containing protein [Candidatus Woesearchaeota archaeon]|nr:Rieske 2Fe-2S domain-containing protein [Candidatus Woesearchaeota archaeon]
MPKFVAVAKTSEIDENQAKVVEVEGKPVALFRVQGKFYAVSHTCAHAGGPIGEGYLSEHIVTCPWHSWQYDIRTGKSISVEGAKIPLYKVKVEKDMVFVAVP